VWSSSEVDGNASVLGDKRNLERLMRAAIEGVVDASARGDRVTVDASQGLDFVTLRVTGHAAGATAVPMVASSIEARAAAVHPTGQLAFLLVDRIARIHGGSATQSADSDGHRVVEARLPRFDRSPIPPSPRVERRLDGTRVLVFAPNDDLRELAAIQLRDNGAKVLSARDAATTAAAVNTFQPDVVVADLAAADDDGERLLDRMQASLLRVSPAIVGLASAPGPNGSDGNTANLGAHVSVRLPLDADTLVQAVVRARARAETR
jgi:CheY-like chemotaxis protein